MFKKHTLSIFLFLLVVLPSLADIRIIPITVVVESNFCVQHMPWKWSAKKIVKEMSREFEEAGLKFEVEKMIKMAYKPRGIEADLFHVVQRVDPPEDGIVIILSSKQYGNDYLFYEGFAQDKGRYCIVTDSAQFLDGYNRINIELMNAELKKFAKMLAHEVCHLFGIEHTDNPDTLMHPIVKLTKAKISRGTAEKIMKVKDVAFKSLFKIKTRRYQPEEQK